MRKEHNMDIKQVEDKIFKEFGKKIKVLVYLNGNYYFGLNNDPELDFTMNIRYYDPSENKFEIFNGMDDTVHIDEKWFYLKEKIKIFLLILG